MKKIDIEKGSKRADARFRITVEETGPYLIYGQPPLAQQFIMPEDRKSTRLNSSHVRTSRMPSSA